MFFFFTVGQGAHLFAHTPFADHFSRQLGATFDIIAAAGGDFTKDQLLSNPAAEQNAEIVLEK